MDAPMTPREAVAWLLENTAATRKTYCIILRSTNGVHNPGTRGMLICQAAEPTAPRMPSAGPMKSSLPIWTACRKPPPP